eukprot:2306838-Pyramimonas_sp.AAC.1
MADADGPPKKVSLARDGASHARRPDDADAHEQLALVGLLLLGRPLLPALAVECCCACRPAAPAAARARRRERRQVALLAPLAALLQDLALLLHLLSYVLGQAWCH